MIKVSLELNEEFKEALKKYPEELPNLYGDRILHAFYLNSPYDEEKSHQHLRDSWGYYKTGRRVLNFFNTTPQHYYLWYGNQKYGSSYIKPVRKGVKSLVFPWRRFGYDIFFFRSVRGIKISRPLFELNKTYSSVIWDSVADGIEQATEDLQDFLDDNGAFERYEKNIEEGPEEISMPWSGQPQRRFVTKTRSGKLVEREGRKSGYE